MTLLSQGGKIPPFSRYGQGDQYMSWRQILIDSGYDPDVAPFPGLMGPVFNVKAFGAVGDGVVNDGPAWNAARAALPAGGGAIYVPSGSYALTTAFTFASATNVRVIMETGVALSGSALPAASGTNTYDVAASVGSAGTNIVQGRMWPVSPSAATAGRGPLAINIYESTFNGELDPSIYVGYNFNGAGALIRSGEPGVAWGIEGNYNDGSGQNKMEAYVQFLATDGTARRPFFSQYDRVTKETSVCRLNGNTVQILNGDQSKNIANFTVGEIKVMPNAGADSVMALSVDPGGASNGFFGLGLSSTVFASWALRIFMATAGTENNIVFSVQGRDTMHLYSTPGGGAGDAMAIGVNDNGAVGTFNNTGSNSIKGVVARAKSTQTGNLFEAQDSSAVQLWAVDSVGTMIAVTATTAKASIRLPHGTAPSAPTNGDMWTTTAGLFVRVNGATVGPLS